MHKVLLIEDDLQLAETIIEYLTKSGYDVIHAIDGRAGLALALSPEWNVIILDVMLPHMTGFEICKHLRRERVETPILFLTSKSHVNEIINGLQLGADAYMTKPFQLVELRVRLQSLINRPPQSRSHQVMIASTIKINYDSMTVERDSKLITLRHKEFAILRLLLQHHSRVLTRQYILDHTGENESYAATVDVHISRLRKSLGMISDKQVIETVHGSGYRISLPVELKV